VAIEVVVNTSTAQTVTVKPAAKYTATVSTLPSSNISLGSLTNVDVTDPDDGEALIYDAANNKYIIKEIIVNSNNITNVNGGSF
jgi:hypothetical protein